MRFHMRMKSVLMQPARNRDIYLGNKSLVMTHTSRTVACTAKVDMRFRLSNPIEINYQCSSSWFLPVCLPKVFRTPSRATHIFMIILNIVNESHPHVFLLRIMLHQLFQIWPMPT